MRVFVFAFLLLVSAFVKADTYPATIYYFTSHQYSIDVSQTPTESCRIFVTEPHSNPYEYVSNNDTQCFFNMYSTPYYTYMGEYYSTIQKSYYCLYGGSPSFDQCNNAPSCPTGQTRTTSGSCAPLNVNIAKTIGGETECNPCGKGDEVHEGNPINVATGNKFQVETDYVGTGEFPLTFQRYYNSHPLTYSSDFSIYTRWRHSYEYSLSVTDSKIIAYRPNGKSYNFIISNGSWIPDSDVNMTLINNGNGFSLITADGTKETYNIYGDILALQNNSGITQSLTYNSKGQLTAVTHSNGRALTFQYDDYNRLSSFKDPSGNTYAYMYSSDTSNQDLVKVTYPDLTFKTYEYNEASNVGVSFPHALTGITDENGSRFATFKYDSYFRAISTEHAGGVEKVSISFGNGSSAITDALNSVRTKSFQTINGVVKSSGVNQPAGSSYTAAASARTFDSDGNITSIKDFNGNLSCFDYSLSRNLEIVRVEGLPSGAACPADLSAYTPPSNSSIRKVTTQWHSTFRLPTQIVEANRTTVIGYDASGNVLQKTVSDTNTQQSRAWTYTYNSWGQVLTADGPRTDVSDITTYTYYADSTATYKPGDLWTVTNAKGHVTTFNAYDAHGHVAQLTDPNGAIISFIYDARNRLSSKTVNGAVTTYGYDSAGNLKTVTRPTGVTFTMTYDPAHRLTDITDALGNKIHYTLDLAGNRKQEDIINAAGVTVKTHKWVYDALSRLAQDIGAYNQTKTYGYDANGNVTTITDANSHTTIKSYDTLNRVIQETNAENGQTDYGYDALGHLNFVTDPNNLSTTYQIDALENLLSQTSPNTGVTIYGYDNAGNLTQKTDARNTTGTYSYDVLNRLLSVTYPNGDANVTRAYDTGTNQKGRMTSASRGSVTTTYGYDLLGNVTSTSANSLPWGGSAIQYAYNADNQVTDITYGSSRDVQYQYDTAGQVSQVSVHDYDNGSHSTNGYNVTRTLASGITHLPFGPVNGLTYGNGLALTRTYDNDYRLAGQNVGTNQSLGYGYDLAGNLASLTDGINSNNSTVYTYDPVDRLLSATSTANAFNYTYDLDGNRTSDSKNAATTQYAYDLNSQKLLSQSGANPDTLNTDANGNITLSKGLTLNYGSDQRVASIKQGSSTVATYQYDSFGQRVSKALSTNTQAFDYDLNGRLIHESAAPGNYVYLDGIPLARVDYSVNDVSGNVNSWNIAYYHNNLVGAPLLATDSSGQVTWTGRMDPFGRVLPINPNITQNLRFPGQYYDAESGLHYNKARYYDDDKGRYLQSDPIGLGGGINTYGYVGGNPMAYSDPFGLASCTYSITEHKLVCISSTFMNLDFIGPHEVRTLGPDNVFSGYLDSVNNPNMTWYKDNGPIPTGIYDMSPNEKEGHKGWWALQELGWNKFDSLLYKIGIKRGGANLHIGNTSLGCITVKPALKDEYNSLTNLLENESGFNTLFVSE